MEIASVSNEVVKECAKLQQKKYRDMSGEFLLEGFKAIEEWYLANRKFKRIFVLKEKAYKYSFLKSNLILTNSAVLKKISSTSSEPEAVAIAEKIEFDINMLSGSKRVLLLEGIKDAGNMGTILRCAVAFNVDAVILYGNCIDIYNPKCLRSSVGNFGKIPIFEMNSIEELNRYFSNYERIATLPRSNNLLKQYSSNRPLLLMFGSEADGLSKELTDFATNSVKIEMSKEVESLNLGVSCAIILYETMSFKP